MPNLALPAHFDGDRIQLDEPFRLPKNARLLVVVMNDSSENEEWTTVSKASLARAYSADEPEYTAGDVTR